MDERSWHLLFSAFAACLGLALSSDLCYNHQTQTYDARFKPASNCEDMCTVTPYFSPDHSLDTYISLIESATETIDIYTPGQLHVCLFFLCVYVATLCVRFMHVLLHVLLHTMLAWGDAAQLAVAEQSPLCTYIHFLARIFFLAVVITAHFVAGAGGTTTLNLISLFTGMSILDIVQSYPLRKTRFGQYYTSPHQLRWGDQHSGDRTPGVARAHFSSTFQC